MTGKTPDVHFVNDQIFNRSFQRFVAFPVEIFKNQPRTERIKFIPVGRSQPGISSSDCFCIRVGEDFTRVETMPCFGLERSIHPVTVFQGFVIEIENNHGIYIPDHELLRKWNFGKRLLCIFFEQNQCARSCRTRINREINAVGNHCCTKWQHMSPPVFYSLKLMRWVVINSGIEFGHGV